MTLDERTRHALFVRLEEVLGPNEATTLMEYLPPTGWADVTTKRDLDHFAAVTRADFERLEERADAKLDQFETRLTARFDQLEVATRAEVHALEAKLFAAILQQNRALFFAMAGLMVTLAALAFGAARLG